MSMYFHERFDAIELDTPFRRVSGKMGLKSNMVVKDYCIQHFLYVLKEVCDFDVHPKGGTSLSKGFRILDDRFSAELDLVIEAEGIRKNSKSELRVRNSSRR